MILKALPREERPRERLTRYGAEALSSVELLAILLGSGTQSRSVLELAADLLVRFGSLQMLKEASLSELRQVKGIGLAKAIQLHAAFALYRKSEEKKTLSLDTPEKVYELIRFDLQEQKREVLMVVLRDVRYQLIHREILFKGTLTEILLHPREIYPIAIKHRAHNLVIAHNHPSGDPAPSAHDLEMTQLLAAAGRIVGIQLSDHLIIGKNSFLSFHQKGLIQANPE